MEAGKPKYSLFPAPPLSKPLPATQHRSPAFQESAAPDLGGPTLRQERSSSPPPAPSSPESQSPSDSPEPFDPKHLATQPSQERPSPKPDSPTYPSDMTASSFSITSESSLKSAPLPFSPLPEQPRKRAKRAFIRHGLGGAGNYHRRPEASPNPEYSGFFSSLLGTFSNKKRKAREYSESTSPGYSQYSKQALPLGAAEVLKRKMLGQASGGKRSTSSDRN